MRRKQNFQTISWFWDIFKRELLDLEPPYQRRSVWNQTYKNYFIDTIILGYPAPAIFLYEQIDPDGGTRYHVVDGKQRLTTIFEFADNHFPISSNATIGKYRDLYFRDLPDDTKRDFWGYPFSVEYVPTDDETVIDNIFDRINRNMAKLTSQELRHAKFSGEFITCAEDLTSWMNAELGDGFPNIADKSRRQMKDVELVAHILLQLERGPRGYSTTDLDNAFSERDEEWERRTDVERRFRKTVSVIKNMLVSPDGDALMRSRMRNQADFYSLFGAIDKVLEDGVEPTAEEWASLLINFAERIDNEEERKNEQKIQQYYDATRSASNDTGPRQTRIDFLALVLQRLPLNAEVQ